MDSRKTLDSLGVVFDSIGKLTSFERSVALFSSLFRFGGVDICLLVLFDFCLFRLSKFGQDIRGSVLRQRLLEELDGVFKVVLLQVR